MRPILGKFIYTFLIWIILIALQDFLDIETAWWINTLIVIIGWFFGSFFYTQFHGNQVMELKHYPVDNGDYSFQVVVKISGRGHFRMTGRYIRVEQYSDLVLQSKLFATLNKFPGTKWIKEFVDDKVGDKLMVFVDDYDSVFKTTSINFEKAEKLS